MANKPINARVSLKHDVEANWIIAGDNGFCPLAGEVIIYDIDNSENGCSQYRYKIGRKDDNGNLINIKDLPFVTNIHIGEAEPINAPAGFMWFDNNCLKIKNVDGIWLTVSELHDIVGRITAEGGEIFNDYENNRAEDKNTHAEGRGTRAMSEGAHTEGIETIAYSFSSHAEGTLTRALGSDAHSEGCCTVAFGHFSHAEGDSECGVGDLDLVGESPEYLLEDWKFHSEFNKSMIAIGECSHVEGLSNCAYGKYSHAEGHNTLAEGDVSHAEGWLTEAVGYISHAEGKETKAIGSYSHAEGDNTQANGDCSHTEGKDTIADNTSSHAEGDNTAAYGKASHAEGAGDVSVLDCLDDVYDTDLHEIKEKWNEDHFALAYGYASHTEGNGNIASGYAAHAEGEYTDASGNCSHTEGQGAVALGEAQHVQGKYNIKDENNKFAHIVGNGEGENKRSNAHTIDWNGNAWFAGDIKIGGEDQDDPNSKFVATVEDLEDNIENALFIFDKNTRTFKYSGFTLDSFKEQIVAEVIAQLSK